MFNGAQMQSRNPVLRRAGTEYSQEGYVGTGSVAAGPNDRIPAPTAAQLAAMYNQPPAGVRGPVMTLNDVVVKSGLLFAILLAGAVVGWIVPGIWVVGLIVGLVLGMVNAFKREVSPILVILYAAFEGLAVGGLSAFYQAFGQSNGYGNLVLTAVISTFAVMGVMLTLYLTGIIKVTARFQKVMMVALVSYMVFAFISLIAAFAGVGNGFGFFGVGWIGIALSAFVVVLAAFLLTMDFEMIAQYTRAGVPERESWRMAFGLMVTIVWLYLEILRLLAIVSSNSR